MRNLNFIIFILFIGAIIACNNLGHQGNRETILLKDNTFVHLIKHRGGLNGQHKRISLVFSNSKENPNFDAPNVFKFGGDNAIRILNVKQGAKILFTESLAAPYKHAVKINSDRIKWLTNHEHYLVRIGEKYKEQILLIDH